VSVIGGFLIYCDTVGCTRRLGGSHPFNTRTDAKRYARNRGWAVNGKGDIIKCPTHRRVAPYHEFVRGESWHCGVCNGHEYLLIHKQRIE
jgi:hypothetical protein